MNDPPPLNKRLLLKWTYNMLKGYNIRPRKKLSQNFVVDPRIIKDVISRINPIHRVIEIGAGLGTLSYYVSRKTKKYSIHFEIDDKLCIIASKMLNSNSILVNGDALDHEWRSDEVVGNLPYHITSDILVKTARSNNVVKAVYVLQKDVVDRLVASPGTHEYGRITILIRILFNIVKGPIYAPPSFYPRPDVYSQLVVLERKRIYNDEIAFLEEVTRKLFHKRRRKLSKVIREEYGIDGEKAIRELGLREDIRVYMVDPDCMLRLARYLKNIVST